LSSRPGSFSHAVVFETNNKQLRPPVDPIDRALQKPCRKGGVPADALLVTNLDARDAASGEMALEAPADGLDFRQFGHGQSVA
jgi:hypothetical protein